MLLMQRNATVTIVHSRTVDAPNVVREADIVVAAVGASVAREIILWKESDRDVNAVLGSSFHTSFHPHLSARRGFVLSLATSGTSPMAVASAQRGEVARHRCDKLNTRS